MFMKVKRYKDGRLEAVAQHENNSYFWKSDLTESIVLEDEKLRIETTLALDLWNRKYHDKFEHLWQIMKNLDVFKSFFQDRHRQYKP